MIKKLCVLLAVLLSVAGASLALEEEGILQERSFAKRSMMLEGTVEPGKAVAVTAPFGGVLLDTPLDAGDIVQIGDVLHTIQTTKVYAPFDGTVGSVGLRAGDEAARVQERYGALMYIEPASPYVISTTTANAHDAPENYTVHVGETVYLRSTETHARTGAGFVTLVEGRKYSVEVTGGNLRLDEHVHIYRSGEYAGRTRIGSGRTRRNADVAIAAEGGAVYRVHVEQGDAVKRGDLLLELVTGAIPMQELPENRVRAQVNGVVASVDAAAGETVAKNQRLSTLYPFDHFRVAAPISESDLPYVEIGDAVRIELADARASLRGTVADISGLNTAAPAGDADAAGYTVYIDFPRDEGMRQGMNVKVYFNEE